MQTLSFYIPAISCHHCVHTIKTELSDLSGVKMVEGDPALKRIHVEFELPASKEQIISLLTEIGYPPADEE